MLVAQLIKEVGFEQVKKELVLSDKKAENVLPQYEAYYETLKKVELSSESQTNKIQMSREYFDIAYFVGAEKKDVLEELTTLVPVEVILASKVAEEDVTDLDKSLIVAGVLSLLTLNGTCFSEGERQAEVDALKVRLEEVQQR